jgi:hypothetical protein
MRIAEKLGTIGLERISALYTAAQVGLGIIHIRNE